MEEEIPEWVIKAEKLYANLPFLFQYPGGEVYLSDWVKEGMEEGYAACWSLQGNGKFLQEHLINSMDIEKYLEHKLPMEELHAYLNGQECGQPSC